jgi:hypothetical protein
MILGCSCNHNDGQSQAANDLDQDHNYGNIGNGKAARLTDSIPMNAEVKACDLIREGTLCYDR